MSGSYRIVVMVLLLSLVSQRSELARCPKGASKPAPCTARALLRLLERGTEGAYSRAAVGFQTQLGTRMTPVEPEPEELEPADAELEVAIGRLLAVTGHAHERQAQLQQALESRVVIEQAKGILAERHQITLDEAFNALRQGARSTQTKLHDLAAEVTTTRETPAAIVGFLPG